MPCSIQQPPQGSSGCWFCASRRACCAAYEPIRCTVLVPAGMTAACSCCQFCRGCAFRDSQTSNADCIRMLPDTLGSSLLKQDALLPPVYLAEHCRTPIPASAMPAGTLVSREVPLTGSVSGLQTASQLLWENLAGGLCFHWLTRLG